MKKRVLFPIIAIVFSLIIPIMVQAQDPGGLPAVNDVPIDGGLSVLIAAGVGYGIKKVRDGRKDKQNQDLLSK